MEFKSGSRRVNDFALVSCTHQTPLEVLLLLCIPVVDPDKEDKNWRRPLNCLQLITAPVVCVLAFQSGKCKCISFHDKSNMTYCKSHKVFLPVS